MDLIRASSVRGRIQIKRREKASDSRDRYIDRERERDREKVSRERGREGYSEGIKFLSS